MNDIGDDDAVPAPSSDDRGDAALDAALSAANAGMVAAIRRGFDLDAGLARIIGSPPQVETRSPGPPAASARTRPPSFSSRPDSDWSQPDPYVCSVDVGTQIARLRFRILEVVRQSQAGESASVLLRAAAGNLLDVHRGIEGKALSGQAAGNLLDAACLALETASDVEAAGIACPDDSAQGGNPARPARYTNASSPLLSAKRILRKRLCWPTGSALLALGAVLLLALAVTLFMFSMSWLQGVLGAFELRRDAPAEGIVMAVNVAILGLLLFNVPRRLFRLVRRRSERISAVTEAIKARAVLRRQAADVSRATAVLRRNVQSDNHEGSDARTYVALLHAMAQLQRPPAHAATSRIDVLREELDSVRPKVMKLFDGAGDCSPCAPR